jgi:FkbM family methyltransferase
MDLVERNGFWWPANDDWCHKVIHSELGDLDAAVRLTSGRDVAVQAGGNVGVWAAHLAKQFAKVVTVEPDAANYECLQRNVPFNVSHRKAAFGAAPGFIDLVTVDGNAGAHYARNGAHIPVVTVDSMGLEACDLLCLDVEGYEPLALAGAEQTIRKFRPVVMFEEKGLSERYYKIKRDSSQNWLAALGYKVRGRLRADVLMTAA